MPLFPIPPEKRLALATNDWLEVQQFPTRPFLRWKGQPHGDQLQTTSTTDIDLQVPVIKCQPAV